MPNQKITFQDKVGIKPKTVRINQVWDDDMNQIKQVINQNDDKALYNGSNTLNEITTIQVTPTFSLNINDGKVTGILIGDELLQLDGVIKIIPSGVTPEAGKVIGWTNADGTIGKFDLGAGTSFTLSDGNGTRVGANSTSVDLGDLNARVTVNLNNNTYTITDTLATIVTRLVMGNGGINIESGSNIFGVSDANGIRINPSGINPVPGNALVFTDVNGGIGQAPIGGSSITPGVGITESPAGTFNAGGTIKNGESVFFTANTGGLFGGTVGPGGTFEVNEQGGSGIKLDNTELILEGDSTRIGSLNNDVVISMGDTLRMGGTSGFEYISVGAPFAAVPGIVIRSDNGDFVTPIKIRPQNDANTGQVGYLLTKIADDGTVGWQPAPSGGGLTETNGTFTPTLSSINATYTFTGGGTWNRIGRQVFVKISLTSVTMTGTPLGVFTIQGLPFTPADDAYLEVGAISGSNMVATVTGQITPGSTDLLITDITTSNAQNSVTFPTSGNTGVLIVNGIYLTDD